MLLSAMDIHVCDISMSDRCGAYSVIMKVGGEWIPKPHS